MWVLDVGYSWMRDFLRNFRPLFAVRESSTTPLPYTALVFPILALYLHFMNMMLYELFMQFSTLTKFRDKPIFTLASLPKVFMALQS